MALAVAEALGALHAAGYRHGDVKPSNIGFTAGGAAKLLDFGLAGLIGSHRPAGGGTVAYLSPEVLGGAPAGAVNDIWALAVVLYEMIAGQRPFAGKTVDEVVDNIARQRLRPPPALSVGGARAWGAVLAFAAGMLTAPPRGRPATAGAFEAALRAAVTWS